MAARHALVLEHVRHEHVAALRVPLEAAGYAIETIHVPDAVPDRAVLDADLLIVLGGPMGVYEQDAHPWLKGEIAAIAARLRDARPTLGICLGAQLVATALGGRVFAGPTKEVGFAPVELSPVGATSPLRHLAGTPVLHWHGDTFTLPVDVTLLASTARYPNQAFRVGDWLLAVQFHPEMGLDADFDAWLAGCDHYAGEAGTTPAHLAQDYAALGPAAATAGRAMLEEWLARLP